MIIEDLQQFCHFLQNDRPIIAVDYGEKKVGIAISNPARTVSLPLKVIQKTTELDKIKEILAVVTHYSACAIIIGLPVNMNGQLGSGVVKVQEFAKLLEQQSDLPIYFQDERLTSKTANNLLKPLNIKREERNKIDDAVAASLILDTVLSIIACGF